MLRPVRLVGLSVALGILASALGTGVIAPAAHSEDYRLPATDFRPCVSPEQFYCVESVTFETDGFPAATGVWVPTGQAIPSDDTAAPVPAVQPTSPTRTFPGRWSFPGFPVDMVGYDGVYVQVGPTSAGADIAWIRLQPASARADATVGWAVTAEGSTVPRDLDPATKTTVVIRFGPLEPTANILVANGSMKSTPGGAGGSVTFSGYPVDVAQAGTSASCSGEDGVARAKPFQQFAFVAFGNTRQAYGYDGMSGNLSISTNGTCYITTPSYSEETGEFSFVAAAPHFAPDGVTVNRGFYVASIPLQDAALLFGISDPKEVKAALVVSMENDNGVEIPVTYTVGVRKGVISVAITGFQFSKPTITVKVKEKLWKKKYKKLAQQNRKQAGN